MKNKFFAIIGGTLLSLLVLAGCGADEQDPPPEDGTNVQEPGTNGNMEDDNGVGTDNGNNNTIGDSDNDMNLDGDGDMMEDDNTPGEDIIEDGLDMNDEDNQDR